MPEPIANQSPLPEQRILTPDQAGSAGTQDLIESPGARRTILVPADKVVTKAGELVLQSADGVGETLGGEQFMKIGGEVLSLDGTTSPDQPVVRE